MKKKKRILMVTLAAVLVFGTVWFLWLMPAPKLAAGDVTKLTVTMLPSPPTTKTIEDRGKIQAFADAYNAVPLQRSPHLGSPAGWMFRVDTNHYRYGFIVISGDEISVHGIWYRTGHDSIEKFEKAIKNLI